MNPQSLTFREFHAFHFFLTDTNYQAERKRENVKPWCTQATIEMSRGACNERAPGDRSPRRVTVPAHPKRGATLPPDLHMGPTRQYYSGQWKKSTKKMLFFHPKKMFLLRQEHQNPKKSCKHVCELVNNVAAGTRGEPREEKERYSNPSSPVAAKNGCRNPLSISLGMGGDRGTDWFAHPWHHITSSND